MIQALWQYVKKKKLSYIIMLVTIFIEYFIVLVPTNITQHLIDKMTNNVLTSQELLIQLIILFSATIIAYISFYIWAKILFGNQIEFQANLRQRMFGKLLSMRAQFYEKFRSGDMLTRFTNDTEAFSEFMGYGMMSVLYSLAVFLFIVPAMSLISWEIMLVSATPFVFLGAILIWFQKKQEVAVEKSREAVSNLSDEVLEVVEGIRVARAYGKKELGTKRFRQKTSQLKQKANGIMRYQAMYGRLGMIFVSLSTMIVVGMGALYMKDGRLTLGQVVALQLYALYFMDPIWMLTDFIFIYQSGKVSFAKLMELLNSSDDLQEDGTTELDMIHSISFNQYSFKYMSAQEESLKNITVTLHKGQTLGVVGKTGSGKTTFVRQLLLQYPIGTGKFSINEEPVTQFVRKSIERQIGYVPQEHVLFSKSVKENILVGNPNADILDIATAIETAAFTEDAERMSDGIDTLVGEKGVSISGGQKQRISIARAFIKQPELLILDDSLSAVDAKTERKIIEHIQAIRQDKTNIIVSHRLSSVMHADWIIVLDNGVISEEGTPQTLLEQKGWYYEQYQRQQLEVEEDEDSHSID
ncbi:ATP-binding cassette domain-containing protein [Granulicatella sp. zg-ZJ]|uniref:ABC transporter ATP-binding protein n=1 Tax=Granulicatella sp. zg-ZJ TaxID=2678504 RepID=UPI0013D4E14F|nr:ABC transporter ATP-binding protein [Granulicatella sp. zg-ZJ]NEW61893.1 ATP-binding cassette domain-containing protein [Granulicatella sp. zg-ZJ]